MTIDGIDAGAVTAWLAARAEVAPPLAFTTIEGGRSNLTYRIEDRAGKAWVLRRPPLHSVLASAHDVGREHRLIAALAGSDVPVPPVVGYEPGVADIGAPFYVMDFVDGMVVRDTDVAHELAATARATVADDLVDVLARLHAVDVDAVGLADLAQCEDYIGRQLRRWHGVYHAGGGRDLPLVDEVHRRLSASIPEQRAATVVHGDYRLDNLIVSPAGYVQAVLDWELATLGDPLADVGLLLVYWTEPGDRTTPLLSAPTTVAGFPGRQHVVDRYAQRSGRDVSQLDYYVAFGLWKLACILEGVYRRFEAGAYGDTDTSHEAFGDIVVALAEDALTATEAAGR